jgi:hypothetical protein
MYDHSVPTPDKSAITSQGASRESLNSWTLMVQSALRAPDSHIAKSLRTLLFGVTHYGTKGPGEVPGAFDSSGNEVIPGLKSVGGTIFTRAAGAH